MNDGINEAKQGLNIIHQVQTILPDIQKLGNQADDFATTTKNGAEQLKSAVPSISSSVQVTLQAIGQVATTTQSITSDLSALLDKEELTPDEKAHIASIINDFQNNLSEQQTAIEKLNQFLADLKKTADDNGNTEVSQNLATIMSRLDNLKNAIGDISTRFGHLNDIVQNGTTDQAKDYLNEINSAAVNVANVVNSINAEQVGQTVSTILDKLINTITTARHY